MAQMEQYYGTGRRKTSKARVYLRPGKGKITINKETLNKYFPADPTVEETIKKPLRETHTLTKYDIVINVKGGGTRGQADAISHGISRALCEANPAYRFILKRSGLLTRDPRMVERKKYGRKKARKSFQFSKR